MGTIIKKIFYFFLPIILFTACNQEPTDIPETPNYVQGVWDSYYKHTDSLVITRVFTKDFYSYFTFADGKVQTEMNKQHYRLTDNQIILEQYTQRYVLQNDSLWITNSKGDRRTVYVRQRLRVKIENGAKTLH